MSNCYSSKASMRKLAATVVVNNFRCPTSVVYCLFLILPNISPPSPRNYFPYGDPVVDSHSVLLSLDLLLSNLSCATIAMFAVLFSDPSEYCRIRVSNWVWRPTRNDEEIIVNLSLQEIIKICIFCSAHFTSMLLSPCHFDVR